MSAPMLYGFAFGEHLEGPTRRSLGYRLLAPAEPETWCPEIEALARRLQAAPYPDHWPPTDLFASVLLADGRRVVALARYGLADHTASRRRGGLELIGVVGPGSLGVPSALAIYHWLREQRATSDDLRTLGGRFALADVLAAVPPMPPPAEPVPVLPVRLWQDGAFLFAATVPSDPNQHLALLDQGASATWQWLPLVGPDFPLQNFAQRGPLVAWTPHLAGVAVKLDRKPSEAPGRLGLPRGTLLVLTALLLALGGANLWATLSVKRGKPGTNTAAAWPTVPPADTGQPAPPSDEGFVRALHHLLQKHGGLADEAPAEVARQFDRLAAGEPDLQRATTEGKELAVALTVLSRRTTRHIEGAIRKAMQGYDPRLIDLACRQVRERLAEPGGEG